MTKDNFTSIGVIIDKSGSMAHLTKDTIGGYNSFIKEQKAVPGDAVLTLALFSDKYELVHDSVPLKDVLELTEGTYKASGSTALLDAIGTTVNAMGVKLASMKEEERPSKVIVLIMTDGEENYSAQYKHDQIMNMINHQRDKYAWEFVFIGANQDAIQVGATMGVQASHSYNYVATSLGTQAYFQNASAGMTDFRKSARGTTFSMVDPTLQVTPVVTGTATPVTTGQVVTTPADPNDTK